MKLLQELSKYLSADLHATQELYNELNKQINTEDNIGLVNTIDLTNDVSLTLARIYQRGFSVNTFTLDLVRKEFTKEKSEIENQKRFVEGPVTVTGILTEGEARNTFSPPNDVQSRRFLWFELEMY